ncbi:MAG: hypothetical protein ACTSPI_06965, partial [Candidatus Heimdallarchaeaceae archaeon]
KQIIFGKPYKVKFYHGHYSVFFEGSVISISTPASVDGYTYLKEVVKVELKKKLATYIKFYAKRLDVNYKK